MKKAIIILFLTNFVGIMGQTIVGGTNSVKLDPFNATRTLNNLDVNKLDSIKINTEKTAINTVRQVHERWPLIVSLMALVVAGVTLCFTIKTTKSQMRTERNTRRKLAEHESLDLQNLTERLLQTYKEIMRIVKFRDQPNCSKIPMQSRFEQLMINCSQVDSSECIDADYDRRILHQLLLECREFNEAVNTRIVEMEGFERNLLDGIRYYSYDDMLNRLEKILDLIFQFDQSLWKKQNEKNKAKEEYRLLYRNSYSQNSNTIIKIEKFWETSYSENSRGGSIYFSNEPDFKNKISNEWLSDKPEDNKDYLHYCMSMIAYEFFSNTEDESTCDWGFMDMDRYLAEHTIPEYLYVEDDETLYIRTHSINQFPGYLSKTQPIELKYDMLCKFPFDQLSKLEDFLRILVNLKQRYNADLKSFIDKHGKEKSALRNLLPINKITMTIVTMLFVYEATFEVESEVIYGESQYNLVLSTTTQNRVEKEELFKDFFKTIKIICNINKVVSFKKTIIN